MTACRGRDCWRPCPSTMWWLAWIDAWRFVGFYASRNVVLDNFELEADTTEMR